MQTFDGLADMYTHMKIVTNNIMRFRRGKRFVTRYLVIL